MNKIGILTMINEYDFKVSKIFEICHELMGYHFFKTVPLEYEIY